MHINAWRGQAPNEPTTLEQGLKQLGVTQKPLTLEERGLFHLNDTEMWHQLSLEKEGPYEFWSETTEVKWLANLPTNTIFTPYDTGLGMLMRNTSFFNGYGALNQANEDLSLFVQTVIQETGSPARAMQALQHVIFSSRYYRYLPMFSTPIGQAVTYDKEAIQPVRIRGYVAVMVAIGVHILTVFYILMVFGVLQGQDRLLPRSTKHGKCLRKFLLFKEN
ncbi:hypothetical protein LTR24_005145 [Lithohypha guttulata]|uniref:Uncharacterized protein n=1 Tax=Lithohypha guttulata TaxID=1690604 RepID=A0ABR0K9Z1_9EURO|nr:hypothetical protein LTR24_005145 [Lithohypha guttulata]